MNNITIKTASIYLLFTLTTQVNASEVTLEMIGKGQVQSTNQTCESSCNISTKEADQTLVAKANDGWIFSGWEGQKCDMGSKAIILSEVEDRHKITTAAGGAKTLETIDFNNDGIDDLIGINLFDGEVLTIENIGDGSYRTQVLDKGVLYPSALDSYDWNSDGYLDLFVAEYGTGDIKMYLNDGNGSFIYHRTFAFENTRVYAFSVVDYDLDNSPDFVISSFHANTLEDLFVLVKSISNEKITWFKNIDDSFVEQEIIAKNAAMTLDTFQSTPDTTPLILTAEILTGEIAVYSGEKGSHRLVTSTGGNSYGAAFGDVDEDGYADILAAHYSLSALTISYANGLGGYSSAQTLALPAEGLTATAFGDFNNDSYLDVATGEFNNKSFYYYATKSFQDCIVKKASGRNVVAVFKETVPSGDNVVKEATESSGGSVYWLLIPLLALILKLNRVKNKK
jgi:hypothetical protein